MRLKQLIVLLITAAVAGCSSQNSAQQPPSSAATAQDASYAAPNGSERQLEDLRLSRLGDSFVPSSTIFPGDVIQVSVPDLEEIKEKTARVSTEGTITLPIAGSVYVAGLSEEQASAAIKAKLSKLVKDPEVDTLVLRHTNRQVAVVGIVNRPGLYPLNSRDDTILDVITRAGGMGESAGSTVLLIPASHRMSGSLVKPTDIAEPPTRIGKWNRAQVPDRPLAPEQSARPEIKQVDHDSVADGAGFSSAPPQPSAIVISMVNSKESNLDVPVRPGDVIMIPARGEVLVQGWVQNPGAYQITPGMTALGAVTAAGGQLFSSSAKVLRAGAHGEKFEIPVDLAKVEHGQQPDVTVQSGDVIIVARSVTGAVPYALYTMFGKFGAGLAIPVY
jgi:polysaccharide export outer membrane protein